MSSKEANRLTVIQRVLGKEIKPGTAAQQLGVTNRQIRRLCEAVRKHGAAGLISKRRGQPSNRRISVAHKSAVMRAVHERYYDFGSTLAAEYLAEADGLKIGVETLRGWMIEAGLWRPKRRRAARSHPSRERRAHRGELVQIDGSHHDWFEGCAPKCCLIAFIDDATSQVLAARFFGSETTQGYFAVMQAHIEAHGVALAYYSDRHSIFTKHDAQDPDPTQFERACLQLGVETICAYSPQAKGRVERLFSTVQDRMCKAMRLAGISSIEQANAWLSGYIQQHNQRFAVAAQQPEDAHRAWTREGQELARICSTHYQRQLSNALSCQFEGEQIWVDGEQPHAPKGRARVDIAQYGDGRIEVLYRGQVLKHKRYMLHEHLKRQRTLDDKSINQRVDALAAKQRHIASIAAQIKLQDDMRSSGKLNPDTKPSPMPGGLSRLGLRPAQLNPLV